MQKIPQVQDVQIHGCYLLAGLQPAGKTQPVFGLVLIGPDG